MIHGGKKGERRESERKEGMEAGRESKGSLLE